MRRTYLNKFRMPSVDTEHDVLSHVKMTCFNNFYPFDTLPENFRNLEFSPLTILYGGNGCGKTTILNLIAEKLGIKRGTKINKSSFMENYLELCRYDISEDPTVMKIITSDDVFSNIFLTPPQVIICIFRGNLITVLAAMITPPCEHAALKSHHFQKLHQALLNQSYI